MSSKYSQLSKFPVGSDRWSWRDALDKTSLTTGAHRTLLTALALSAVFITFLAAVQFASPNLAGNDGYYHIKIAYLMRISGLKPDFRWLQLTILNAQEFVDHHFLYHILLIPFTFGDLVTGAKLASVLFPTLAFLAVWWLLRSQGVPFAALWSLGLLAISEAFIYRMSMPRAQSLSLAVLVLALHWLLIGKHRRLLPLAFLYVWLYNAFPLILLLTAVYVAASWLTERRLEWHALAYAAAGIALGVAVNPYFPNNIVFAFHHLGPKLFDPTAVQVGSEWYPYRTDQLIDNSGLALGLFVASILPLGLTGQKISRHTATALLLTLVFGWMVFQSRRFIEYAPAFILIFAALSWAPLSRRWLEGLEMPIDRMAYEYQGVRSRRVRLMVGLMLVMLMPAIWINLTASRESIESSRPFERYAAVAGWLEQNTEPGERIFQTDWDDFTRLFFYNTHNTYMVGLDPTYMQSFNPRLYDLWVEITLGQVADPADEIRDLFGSRYVMTDLNHRDFLRAAANDPRMVEVYRDDEAVVFEVKE